MYMYEKHKEDAKIYSQYYRLSCGTAETRMKKRNPSTKEREEAEMWYKRKQRNNERQKESRCQQD